MNHIISWFEIPVTDMARAKKFYESVLDIRMHTEEVGSSVLSFFPMDGTNISGALIKEQSFNPSLNGAIVFLNTSNVNIDDILKRIEISGGKIDAGRIELPKNRGVVAYMIDSEGNKIGLYSKNQ